MFKFQKMMQSNQIIASLFSNKFEPVQKVMQSNQTIASLFLAYGLALNSLAWAGLALANKISFFSKSSCYKGTLRTAILAVKKRQSTELLTLGALSFSKYRHPLSLFSAYIKRNVKQKLHSLLVTS